MSLATVRPYFRTIIDGLGYEEHRDFVNINNIPGTNIDEAYHIETGPITTNAVDQLTYTLLFPVTIRLFKRGYNDTTQTHEELIVDVDNLLAGVLDPAQKLDGTLFNVLPGNVLFEQLSFDNDNWIVALINFNATIKICF